MKLHNTWQIIHIFQQDIGILITHKRINYNSIRHCLHSLFQVHNETSNIWSHLLPFFFVGLILIFCIFYNPPLVDRNTIKSIPLWPIELNLGCFLLLFLISTIYHSFFCMNAQISRKLLKLDYAAICIVLPGCTIPVL